MFLVGDIGNTDAKICLVDSSKKIVRKINFSSKKITNIQLKKKIQETKTAKFKFKKMFVLFSSSKNF